MNANICLTYDPVTYSMPNPFKKFSPLNCLPGRTKVGLVGFEEQNVRTAPYDDPEWDLWTFNMANRLGFMHDGEGRFRCDRWFDLHEEHAQDEKDMAWIEQCPVPIMLTHDFGTNANRRVLDLAMIQGMILSRYKIKVRMDYFCSSFAYALAMAIGMGYTTIGIFGINLDWGRERIVERGNFEYWIGLAVGLGLRVEMGDRCKLLRHPGLYGIEYDQEKEGVLNICAETMRQLLQSKGMENRLDQNLIDRADALTRIANVCNQELGRLCYQHNTDMAR